MFQALGQLRHALPVKVRHARMEQRGRLCRPRQARLTSWQTFLKAHWGAIAGADFFTTEVWTWRGLVTYYTVFVIDLASRRVQILGSTPHPRHCSWSRSSAH